MATTPDSHRSLKEFVTVYRCPLPAHVVRVRVMGAIASPVGPTSPLETMRTLWGGELPTLPTVEQFQGLLETFVGGIWNDLVSHQTPETPFALVPVDLAMTQEGLHRYARTRSEEVIGFLEGILGGGDSVDVPPESHEALGILEELASMLLGITDLFERGDGADGVTGYTELAQNLAELTKIATVEMNRVIQASYEARQLTTAVTRSPRRAASRRSRTTRGR